MNRIKRQMTTLVAAAVLLVSIGTGIAFGFCPLKAEAAGRPAAISSCLISGSEVVCQIDAGSVPYSDDGKYYIYADEVYEDGPTGDVVATVKAGSSVSVSFPLNYNAADSNLSRKFLVAMKQGGQMVQVSDEHYITNPEALAAYTANRMNTGIKGILPDTTKLDNGDLADLGIQQAVYNMYLDDICSAASVPGAVPFDYNGQTYYFDDPCLRIMTHWSKPLTEAGFRSQW